MPNGKRLQAAVAEQDVAALLRAVRLLIDAAGIDKLRQRRATATTLRDTRALHLRYHRQ